MENLWCLQIWNSGGLMSNSFNIRLYPENIPVGRNGLLKHQEETLDALDRYSIVLNCAMTGAGKTKAAHLGIQSWASSKDVLFVAPTNALVSQHLDDAKKFVREYSLPHNVAAVDGTVLYNLQKARDSIYRSSEALHQLIYNPREFSDELGIDNKSAPLWLITNPDQIWLSIVSGREQDTRNLLRDFINRFRFVVVDEFHYYSAEQLALFFLCTAFWKHFGQFDDGLKMLLLTATPDEMVEAFFRRMGFDFTVTGNNDYENALSVPVLSPVELTLTTGCIHDYTDHVMRRYNEGSDGVIISDSLFEINKAYRDYEKCDISVGRITGPIGNIRRKQESRKRLILATPTVDLGYNFIKSEPKDRQEIDFLVSTARTKSAFWQRLGRAGRVLGRKETDNFSQATMILPNPGCFKRIAEFEGQEMSRAVLRELLDLRDKRLKGNALTREGLYTVTEQLGTIERMLPEQTRYVAEQIFNTLKNCFDPDNLTSDWSSYKKRHGLSKKLQEVGREYPDLKPFHIGRWLRNNSSEKNDSIDVLVGSWAKNHFYREGKLEQYNEYIKENDRMELIKSLFKKKQSLKENIVEYYKEQMLRIACLLNFRGSGSKQEVRIYDPGYLHSAHLVNKIDLVSLLSKYRFKSPLPHSAAEKQWQVRLPKGDMFFELTDFHEYPYRPVFEYHKELPQRPRTEEYTEDIELVPLFWQTVALHDLFLKFENRKTGPLQIPSELLHKLSGLSELFFITPMENRFMLDNWLKEYDVRTGDLRAGKEYSVVYGKDAVFISEELYFRSRIESC